VARKKRKVARKRKPARPAPVVEQQEEDGGSDKVTQLAVRIPSRLYRKVKIHSIATGASMSKITEDAYRTLLQQK
jgi:hypothetical protein